MPDHAGLTLASGQGYILAVKKACGLVVMLVIAYLCPPTSAQQPGGGERLVEQGVKAYLEGDYEKSRSLLEQALSTRLEMARLLGAMQYLAFSLVALGDQEQAALVFHRLLDLSPHFSLPSGTPPKIARVFEAVAAKWRAAHPGPVIHHQPPEPPAGGASLVLSARVEHLRQSEKVLVRYRDGAEAAVNQQEMKLRADGSLEAVLPAPLAGLPLERFYQIEVRAADGTLMARAPQAGAFHLSFAVPEQVEEKEPEKPRRSTWWIWAVAGAVVVGAAVGLGVGLSGGGGPGGRAQVTIVVQE